MAHLKHTTWQTQRGLTLVELMVTIAVIAILATMAVSTMSNMRAKQQVIAAAEEVATLLHRARALARKTSEDVTVDFDNETSWDPSADVISVNPGGSQVTFSTLHSAVQINGADVTYDGVSNLSNGVTIKVRPENSAYQTKYVADITVSTKGRIRICNSEGLDRYGC